MIARSFNHLFDRCPNFAIDTAARMEYLMLTPPQKVKAFLLKYQDRELYGTDLDVTADAKVGETMKSRREAYARDWRYFATNETFELNGKWVRGRKLPNPVLRKLYRSNALHWILRIASNAMPPGIIRRNRMVSG